MSNMPRFIQKKMSAQEGANLKTLTRQGLDLARPFVVTVEKKRLKGRRLLSTKREGYAREVIRVALEFVSSLPRDLNPELAKEDLEYRDMLLTILVTARQLVEVLTDTVKLFGADIMVDVDNLAGALQGARKRNGDLDAAMEKIDQWNAQFGSQPDEEEETDAEDETENPGA